jgi:hypothetical protein
VIGSSIRYVHTSLQTGVAALAAMVWDACVLVQNEVIRACENNEVHDDRNDVHSGMVGAEIGTSGTRAMDGRGAAPGGLRRFRRPRRGWSARGRRLWFPAARRGVERKRRFYGESAIT